MGLNNNKVDAFRVKIENLGADFSSTLSFRIIGMDQLANGHFNFDKRIIVNDCHIQRGEKKWLTLMSREFEWPEEITKITFAVIVDPDHKIDELIEQNNFMERTMHRFNLVPCCDIVLPEKITINGRRVKAGQNYIFPLKVHGTMIGVNLINCGGEAATFDLIFMYDWTPLNSDGENILVRKHEISLKAGKEKYFRFDSLHIPRKKKYKNNYTTFAILRSHEKGYDVLYEMPARAEYVEIVGD